MSLTALLLLLHATGNIPPIFECSHDRCSHQRTALSAKIWKYPVAIHELKSSAIGWLHIANQLH